MPLNDDESGDDDQGVTVLEFTVPETSSSPDGPTPAVEVRLPDFGLPSVATVEPVMMPPTAEEILGPNSEPLEMAKGDATDIDLPHHTHHAAESDATLDASRSGSWSTHLPIAEAGSATRDHSTCGVGVGTTNTNGH